MARPIWYIHEAEEPIAAEEPAADAAEELGADPCLLPDSNVPSAWEELWELSSVPSAAAAEGTGSSTVSAGNAALVAAFAEDVAAASALVSPSTHGIR